MRLKVSDVCQLLDKSKYNLPHTESGLTFTAGTDGSIIVNGTCTSTVWANISSFELNPEHTFILIGCPGTNVNDVALYTLDPVEIDTKQWEEGKGSLVTGNWYKHKNNYLMIRILAGYVCNNLTFKPQLYDLTEMYGAGHEPTTVAQFRQDFPNEMYEYSPVCWKKFSRLKYVTETKNLCDFARILTLPLDKQFESTGFSQVEINVEPNTQYTLSRENNNVVNLGGATYLGMDNVSRGYHPAGFWLNHELLPSYCKQQITIESNADGKLWIFFANRVYIAYKNGQNPFGYLQLELGSTATPYQPYGYLPLNRGKYIANKEPVQLLDKSKFSATQTLNGVTFTNNGDGTITVNGTNNGEIYYNLEVLTSIPVEHKVIIDDRNSTLYFFGDMRTKDYVLIGTVPPRTIFTLPSNLAKLNVLYFVRYNTGAITYNNELSKPQLFDLTAMYGAGNEPTTVAQFRADFPNELYDYNPYNAITFR